MKTLSTLSVMLLLCLFAGCNKESENTELTSLIEVKALPIGTQNVTMLNPEIKSAKTETVFTSDDIISYNGQTGEVILKNFDSNESISTRLTRFDENLNFYKDGVLLFTLKSKVVLDIESAIYNEPILHYSMLNGDKCFIRDGYPWGFPIDDTFSVRTGQSVSLQDIRRTNADKISEGWDIFINELKRENKYIDK
ncbi:MAG: hypothetical protein ACK5M7_00660 [Draconibacterium sp.]